MTRFYCLKFETPQNRRARYLPPPQEQELKIFVYTEDEVMLLPTFSRLVSLGVGPYLGSMIRFFISFSRSEDILILKWAPTLTRGRFYNLHCGQSLA
jgi:hypothetical protein